MKRMILAAALLAMTVSSSVMADETADLRKRVEILERQLKSVTAKLDRQEDSKEDQQHHESLRQAIKELEGKMQSGKKPVLSSLDLEIYGYVKLDASHDTHRVTNGNFAAWVDSDAANDNDDDFNMTANQTRLGVRVAGPQENGTVTSGVVEVDFYDSALGENKPRMYMRHAFMKIASPEDRWDIIAGQYWDIIGPLNPSTLNYPVLWYSGNTGYRRPQIRFTKIYDLGGADLTAIAGVTRNIGTSGGFSPGDDGEDAGFPTVQSRLALTFPNKSTVGFSGHYGQDEHDMNNTGDKFTADSWSINSDLNIPVNKVFGIKGEFFHGKNLGQYLGGIGQRINVNGVGDDCNEIGATGGWLAANFKPAGSKWAFNVGSGVDDVDASDVDDGDRTLNGSIFTNAIYSINSHTQVGLELSQWHTERKHEGSSDSFRSQMSFMYKF